MQEQLPKGAKIAKLQLIVNNRFDIFLGVLCAFARKISAFMDRHQVESWTGFIFGRSC